MIGRAATGVAALAASLCAACAGPAARPAAPDLLTAFRAGCLETLPGFAAAGTVLERVGMAPLGNDGTFDTYGSRRVSVGVNAITAEPVDRAVCVAVDMDAPPRTPWAELRDAVLQTAGPPVAEGCHEPSGGGAECKLRWRGHGGCLGLDGLLVEARTRSAWLFFQAGEECWA